MFQFNKTLVALTCAAGFAIVGCNNDKDGDMNKGKMKSDMPMKSDMSMEKSSAGNGQMMAPAGAMMARGDIIDVATGPGMSQVTTVVKAIQAADLVQTLKGPGPFTVFAPTNAAFDKLPKGTVEDLLKPENKAKLTAILTYHVHAGDAIRADQVKTMSLSTVNGKPLNVVLSNGTVMINDAKVVKTDVTASNGIIHWVDTVLMP